MIEKVNNGRLGDVNIVKDMVGDKKGDIVTIQETNPISKLKSWIVHEVNLQGSK